MAFKLPSSSQHRRSRRSFSPMSEINVTPMVDVMLVLLVIFMVTAPLLTTGIAVDLPKAAISSLTESVEPLTIVINEKGVVFIQETETPLETLTARLIAVTQNNKEARIYVKGDKALSYGEIIRVMGLIGAAGFTKVALLTEAPQTPSKNLPNSRFSSKKDVKG
ncbi:MAG: protein TolR [Proteobacteria bacterium]|nr:protein TolR [Pseudomonadota bacterium]